MNIDLVIFDCDGTLVDSEPLTNRLIAQMIGEKGIEISPKECMDRFVGKNIMVISEFLEERIGPFDKVAFEVEYRSRCLDIFHEELEAIPGSMELVESMKIPFCIASNGPRAKMDVTLTACGFFDMVGPDRIFSAYDIKQWKPDPGLFLHAAQQMGKIPQNTVVIEDSLPGIDAALNASMDVLVYNPHEDPKMMISGVKNFKEMSQIQDFLATFDITSPVTKR